MFSYINEFGFIIAYNKLLSKLNKSDKYYEKKHNSIKKYLLKEEINVVNKYKDSKTTISESISPKIFVFWYQGLENAPEIVKKTVSSIINKSNMEVIILTKDNLKDYTNIDKNIYDKLQQKKITYTFFSDIVRFNVLKNNGGYWLDSTIFMTSPIEQTYKFFTIKIIFYFHI
jgi:hypothetical protein